MKSGEPQPFRPNPKVAMMILVTMTALFVPLLCVVWLGRDYFRAPKPASAQPTGAVIGLRESIERSAEEALPVEAIVSDRLVLKLEREQRSVESLKPLAESLGASLLELEEGRYLVSGAKGTSAAFAKALNIDPPAGDDEGLFEVRIESKEAGK